MQVCYGCDHGGLSTPFTLRWKRCPSYPIDEDLSIGNQILGPRAIRREGQGT
jgi:hypothetical protein